MKTTVALLIALCCLCTPAQAADPQNGKLLARKCSACHGRDGIARDPEVANLAGQSAYYIEKSLHDFRNGAREDRRMTLIVKPLSDQDIKDIAAWYASFEVTVVPPE